MKQIFSILSILTCFTVQAQDAKPAKTLLIGFSFSPDYSYRILNNDDGNPPNEFIIDTRDDSEIPKLGYTTGVNVLVNFSRMIGFETGILFSNKGYKTKEAHFSQNPGPIATLKNNYAYQYIGIPLKVKFSFGNGKVRFITSAGVTANLLLNARQTTRLEYTNGKKKVTKKSTTSEVSKPDISPMISAGIDYRLNKRISFVFEPTFRYSVLSTYDTPITENLWSAGLNLACYYSLN